MTLRALAIAAPEYPEGVLGRGTLQSADPASLFNACWQAAYLAESRIDAWGESNWILGRKDRRQHFVLMHSLADDWSHFESQLHRIRPNLLLIGAMSLCLPGAIACAKRAKDEFGDQICIVLGGWHPTETIYRNRAGDIVHHSGSPVRLVLEGRIDPVFDIVLAGEGEHIIAWLAERVSQLIARKIPPARIRFHLEDASIVPGQWILAWVHHDKDGALIGGGLPINRSRLPAPCEMFGVRTSFDVFKHRLTAHVYSDSGPGCVYDCAFCSERRSNTGQLLALEGAADRLAFQLSRAYQVIRSDSPDRGASAFVEDSTLLGGSKIALRRLIELLQFHDMDLKFGAQLTIDQIPPRLDLLRELKKLGLDYLFIGIETADPSELGGINKDLRSQSGNWLDRTERVLEALSSIGISCGSAILFGAGESRDGRLKLLHRLARWQRHYGIPKPISLNWAVQHPLKGADKGASYKYDRWGVPPGICTEAFTHFGEASVIYPIAGQAPPKLEEVQEIGLFYKHQFLGPESMSQPTPKNSMGCRTMPNITIDRHLKLAAPELTLGILQATVRVTPSDLSLWQEINSCTQDLIGRLSIEQISELPEIRGLKRTYRFLGKDPARFRGSQEALLRRIVKGQPLYRINAVVDINNFVSLISKHSVGSYDLAQLKGDVVFRVGRHGESYKGIGKQIIDIAGLPTFADELGPFGSPTSDSERAMITLGSKRIMMAIIAFSGRSKMDDFVFRASQMLQNHASADLSSLITSIVE